MTAIALRETTTETRRTPHGIQVTRTYTAGEGQPLPIAPEYLRVRQAAQYLSVHPYHLYRLVRTGKLPHCRVGNNIRIRRADLDSYLAARTTRTWSRVDRRGRRPSTPAA